MINTKTTTEICGDCGCPMLGNHGAYCPGCNRAHERIALRRGEAEQCTDAVSFRSNGDQPACDDEPAIWTDAMLREDAIRCVRSAMRQLDIAADRLCVLVNRASDDDADAIEGYARLVDYAREELRMAQRTGLQ